MPKHPLLFFAPHRPSSRALAIVPRTLRCAAAVARKVYLRPGRGVGGLSKAFGSKARRGTKTNTHKPAATGIIRHVLQQLETLKVRTHPEGSWHQVIEGHFSICAASHDVRFAHVFCIGCMMPVPTRHADGPAPGTDDCEARIL